jgi:hypothetical protein
MIVFDVIPVCTCACMYVCLYVCTCVFYYYIHNTLHYTLTLYVLVFLYSTTLLADKNSYLSVMNSYYSLASDVLVDICCMR